MTVKTEMGARQLLVVCGDAKPNDLILIVADDLSDPAARIVYEVAKSLGLRAAYERAPVADMHGVEPPDRIKEKMKEATLILGMTSKSMAHTTARIQACKNGARYLSLPEYSVELLADPCLSTDYRAVAPRVRKTADLFTKGERVRVTTELGTDLTADIRGRVGNYCPGFVTQGGDLGSPPDIEANVSPVETKSEGTVVVDGSIPYPGLGLLKNPVRLWVQGGLITKMEGKDATVLRQLEKLFSMADPKKTKVLAEIGLGFNENATLQGIMLTDEGAAGTAHFGFGSNSTVGGQNEVSFHLDFVFRKPNVSIDGIVLIRDGEFVG